MGNIVGNWCKPHDHAFQNGNSDSESGTRNFSGNSTRFSDLKKCLACLINLRAPKVKFGSNPRVLY